MSESVANILEQRRKTHGPYTEGASFTMTVYDAYMNALTKQNKVMPTKYQDAMSFTVFNIALKLSRAIYGSKCEVDHWKDIAGYATRMVECIETFISSDTSTNQPALTADADMDAHPKVTEVTECPACKTRIPSIPILYGRPNSVWCPMCHAFVEVKIATAVSHASRPMDIPVRGPTS